MQTAIVGDIHGDVLRLRSALNYILPRVDEIFFVGDYVDRGPSSREVVEELCALKAAHPNRVRLLRGNHDDALLNFVLAGEKPGFIAHGGLTTVKSYLGGDIGGSPLEKFRAGFPQQHLQLLLSTEIYIERRGLLVSHCGYNPASPADRGLKSMVNGSFPKIFEPGQPRPQGFVVFGHYVQQTMLPFMGEGLACIDTGCGTLPEGPLTAMLFPSLKTVQF